MREHSKKTIVLDFDRTIFDTDRLYEDLYQLLEKLGVSRSALDYSAGLIPPECLLFNFLEMVRRSRTLSTPQVTAITNQLRAHILNMGDKYVFADVRQFIDAARGDGYCVEILTYGDIDFQTMKFVGSRLSRLCDGFSVTQSHKWTSGHFLGCGEVVFFDDNPRDLDGVKSVFPEVRAVEVKRAGTKYSTVLSNTADFVINGLCWPGCV